MRLPTRRPSRASGSRYPFTSVLLLNLFSSPGIPSHQYYCWTCSHPPVSLYISIIVELVLIPRYPFTSVLLLNLFSFPGIPWHQYYCCTCSHPPVSLHISIIVVLVLIPRYPFTSVLFVYLVFNKFNNNTDVKGYRGMRTSTTIILM
jgi:hypothetical protein